MARKKLFAIDPPTKTVTIPNVPSVIADQFNELLLDEIARMEAAERSKGTKLPQEIKPSKADAKTNVFKKMVLDKRRKDDGDDAVEDSMRRYNETQERFKQLNQLIIEKT
jgi:hypothetical protein